MRAPFRHILFATTWVLLTAVLSTEASSSEPSQFMRWLGFGKSDGYHNRLNGPGSIGFGSSGFSNGCSQGSAHAVNVSPYRASRWHAPVPTPAMEQVPTPAPQDPHSSWNPARQQPTSRWSRLGIDGYPKRERRTTD